MNDYRPRRASAKFLDADCPKGVLAIFDNGGKTFDRYTVVYADLIKGYGPGDWWIGYRGMSENPTDPQGFGIYDEMPARQMAEYRRRAYRESVKWSSLPDAVKKVVRRDCALTESSTK
jgi:hypothetical protein